MVDPLNGRIERKGIRGLLEILNRAPRNEGLVLNNGRAMTVVAQVAVLRQISGSRLSGFVGVVMMMRVTGLVKKIQMMDLMKRLRGNQQQKCCQPQNAEALG
jgi:hypothetical protein